MKQTIFAIETSCDETSVALLDSIDSQTVQVRHHEVFSQIDAHKEYGGVFPPLAKRMHANIFPKQIQKVLEIFSEKNKTPLSVEAKNKAQAFLHREPELFKKLLDLRKQYSRFPADIIAISAGPGLEPALWVGITATQAISALWGVLMLPINHMFGHVASSFLKDPQNIKTPQTLLSVKFPLLVLLVSGKHTELVYFEDWKKAIKLGSTRDDASGECYDKTGRMLGFDYPAGKQISMAAKSCEEKLLNNPKKQKVLQSLLPKPMIYSDDYDFSFSGLKSATRRYIEGTKNTFSKNEMAYAIRHAINSVLEAKTKKAMQQYSPKTLVVAGGVSASKDLRDRLKKVCSQGDVHYLPAALSLCGDNGLMIALAAHTAIQNDFYQPINTESVKAIGRWNIVDTYENALRNY